MKIFEVAQGSPEWHAARAGVISASNVKIARKLVMASGPNKGGPGEECKNYAFRLAIERIAGAALQDERFETYAMRRGHELEPEARRAHERLGVVVRKAGFVTTDDGWFGSSTDGFIDPRGTAEYKCLVSPEGLREILLAQSLDDFQDQMQTGLLVTERDWMHFGLYCPALAPIGQDFTLRVVYRDDVYIKALRRDLATFKQMVQDYEGQLRNRGAANSADIEEALRAAA